MKTRGMWITVMGATIVAALSAARVATQTTSPAPVGQTPAAAPAGNAENGRVLYTKNGCYQCHGFEGQGGEYSAGPRVAPDPIPFRGFVQYVRAPRGQMPPYTAKVMTDQELADVYAFLQARPRPPAVSSIPLLAC